MILIYIPGFEHVLKSLFEHFVRQFHRIVSGYCKLNSNTKTMLMMVSLENVFVIGSVTLKFL